MVPAGRAHGLCLAGLLALFCLRVVAQPLAAAVELPWLPRFDHWHSGALPYPLLVAAQLVILALMVRSTRGVLRGTTRPVARRGRVLLTLACLYAGLMVLRLVLGRTTLAGHPWWDAPLPSAFHLVLAAFLGVLGHHHLRAAAAPG
jgi:hypothetical protein